MNPTLIDIVASPLAGHELTHNQSGEEGKTLNSGKAQSLRSPVAGARFSALETWARHPQMGS
ncbi:hypothetical protein GCM10009655_28990 [Rhodoglobus aureus]|uniref:Uncharacterized protein n=1 Tax=Rhodoglobus aureus TaxID=191497 RepID=A0ABP4GQ89_9MICO